ncbi:MAG: single-stranded DNA-binding protein [Candidatus Hydrothermarchaeota archaeon]
MVRDQEMIKVEDLSPTSRRANLIVKVLEEPEKRTITTRSGETKTLAEVLVGDETATVVMTLWGNQIDEVNEGDIIAIDNGYVSLIRGNMRLNIGKYGSMEKREDIELGEINTEKNISNKTYETGYRRRGYFRKDFSRGERRRY